mmetsp:Transcript_12128/g.10451  ORF Transcript_12128/g.10451 Transcript_12128/m.10451 type:complete len:108 (-) Transcript_12128:276-599(-)|eukprot:CAMPEP_0114575570 /NCGR_PEP_ID=MMETSP0125-20121206/421_1 /TAXON_ID=485358 ORGANISM="Aristerostoma sp., Strain ATCC 50986" /NCGR_SAMPLE_ID=MMETSP0125 /ASSEMBLY_ACC=CAM_ASM_000245 /LENGTH=107 /DNA_ID=CAMNT_0001763395 /DNA_START=827 /DNA_END=1150 /DNA_ORIENTATION=+
MTISQVYKEYKPQNPNDLQQSIFYVPDRRARESISKGEFVSKLEKKDPNVSYEKINVEIIEIKPSDDGKSEEKVKKTITMFKLSDSVVQKSVGLVKDGVNMAKTGVT